MNVKFSIALLALSSLILCITSISHATSVDCSKTITIVEKAICSDKQLSELDNLLMQSYEKALANSSDSDALKSKQSAWFINIRDKCQDSTCLIDAYKDRLTAIRSISESGTPSSQSLPGLILTIKAIERTIIDNDFKKFQPVEVTGKIKFGYDAAGGHYWINGENKKRYTLGYVGDLDKVVEEQLKKLAKSRTTVTVNGTLEIWKDGSEFFDNAKPINIFK